MLLTGALVDFQSEFVVGNYMMLFFLLISSMIALMYGRIYGMLFSMVILLVYSAVVFYQGMLGIDTIIPLNYIWVISYPGLGFLCSILGEEIQDNIRSFNQCNDVKEALVTKDELTGLGNAKEFYQNLKVEMNLGRRHGRVITIALVEVQYLDELIAIYGRTSYSRIFDLISAVLVKCTRTEDTLYRISEKTFAVIMPHTPQDGADIVKERVKGELGEINTFTDNRFEEMHIEVRVGVASLDDSIKSEFEFKKKAEKEVEYDV